VTIEMLAFVAGLGVLALLLVDDVLLLFRVWGDDRPRMRR
jgi:hypothetical protein